MRFPVVDHAVYGIHLLVELPDLDTLQSQAREATNIRSRLYAHRTRADGVNGICNEIHHVIDALYCVRSYTFFPFIGLPIRKEVVGEVLMEESEEQAVFELPTLLYFRKAERLLPDGWLLKEKAISLFYRFIELAFNQFFSSDCH